MANTRDRLAAGEPVSWQELRPQEEPVNDPDRSEAFESEGKSLVTDTPKEERKWPEDFRFGSNVEPPKFPKKK